MLSITDLEIILNREGVSNHVQIARQILEVLSIKQTQKVQEFASDLRGIQSKINNAICTYLDKFNGDDKTVIMPEGVRFMRKLSNFDIVVLEESPRVRTITINAGWHEANGEEQIGLISRRDRYPKLVMKQFRLAFPYVVFVLSFSSGKFINLMSVGFSNKPLATLGDYVYWPPLPNIDDSLGVCMGNFIPCESLLNRRIKEVIGAFWNSDFNYMLTENRSLYPLDQRLKSFTSWAKATTEDQLFPIQVDWKRPCPLSKVIEIHSGRHKGENLIDFGFIPIVNDITAKAIERFKPLAVPSAPPSPSIKPLACDRYPDEQ